MIGYLAGTIVDRGENWLIVKTGGVGYKIFVPADTLLSTKAGDNIELFCHHHITQESQSLYGFTERKDLDLFELMISVSGIGPKSALTILSRAKSEEIEEAIMRGDSALFTAISGVGKKRADHIILELQPKLASRKPMEITVSADTKKVYEALQGLGYRREEIVEVIKGIPPDLSSDAERIKWALRHLYR